MKEKIQRCVTDLLLDFCDIEGEDSISDASTFEELGLTSLDFIELKVVVKRKFNVSLNPELFAKGSITNIKELCEHIHEEYNQETVN